jgi:hypothetical protein
LLPKLELNARFETQLQIWLLASVFVFLREREALRKRGKKKFKFWIEKSRLETKFERKRNLEFFFRWKSLMEASPVSNMVEMDLRWN